jgi:hypothetical protein
MPVADALPSIEHELHIIQVDQILYVIQMGWLIIANVFFVKDNVLHIIETYCLSE